MIASTLRLRSLLLVVAAGLLAFPSLGLAQQGQPEPAQQMEKKTPMEQQAKTTAEGTNVIHLSKFDNNHQAALMALSIARALQKNGEQATLFLDLEGVRLADRNVPLDRRWIGGQTGASEATQAAKGGTAGGGMSIQQLYDEFVSAGGKVLVCQHCASVAGVKEGNLREGAQMAGPDQLGAIFSNASRVIDY